MIAPGGGDKCKGMEIVMASRRSSTATGPEAHAGHVRADRPSLRHVCRPPHQRENALCSRWIRVPVRGSLWLLPPGPDQVRNISSPEPIERTRCGASPQATSCMLPASSPRVERAHAFRATPTRRDKRDEHSYRESRRASVSPAQTRFARVCSGIIASLSGMG